jgi:hypothetical protein
MESQPTADKRHPDEQPSDEDVQHVLNTADATDPDQLNDPYSYGSVMHKSLALWVTLEGTQQRIDDCFTKYCLMEHIIKATKVFNDYVVKMTERHDVSQGSKHDAPDWCGYSRAPARTRARRHMLISSWYVHGTLQLDTLRRYAEQLALRSVLRQLSLHRLKEEAQIAGVVSACSMSGRCCILVETRLFAGRCRTPW